MFLIQGEIVNLSWTFLMDILINIWCVNEYLQVYDDVCGIDSK